MLRFSQIAEDTNPSVERLLEDFEYVTFDTLEEAQIHFSGGAKFGQIVILAGGGGSGKGFAIKKFIQGENFKVFDVDHIKGQLKALGKQGKAGYEQYADLDFANPDDLNKMHQLVKKSGIMKKAFNNFIKANQQNGSGLLPNILFDVTLKDNDEINHNLPELIKLGYKPDNIHLVWVLTNYQAAVDNNISRAKKPGGRLVPSHILQQAHEEVPRNVLSMLKGKLPEAINGKVAIILNNPKNTRFETDRQGEKGRGKERPHAGSAVKSFKYVIVKHEGKPIELSGAAKDRVYRWTRKHTPDTVRKTIWNDTNPKKEPPSDKKDA